MSPVKRSASADSPAATERVGKPSEKAAGATWADVVKTNTFVTDFDEFQKCADICMRYLGVATPTSTTVGVTRLAGPIL
jgi:enamine deaminase RidA (YjgF/YER057c/UK114 family)